MSGWTPACAVCVLVGVPSVKAATTIGGEPVCETHAGLLLIEGLRGAAAIAAEDLGRRPPWLPAEKGKAT